MRTHNLRSEWRPAINDKSTPIGASERSKMSTGPFHVLPTCDRSDRRRLLRSNAGVGGRLPSALSRASREAQSRRPDGSPVRYRVGHRLLVLARRRGGCHPILSRELRGGFRVRWVGTGRDPAGSDRNSSLWWSLPRPSDRWERVGDEHRRRRGPTSPCPFPKG